MFFIWLSIRLVKLIVGLKEIKLWVIVVIEVDNWLQFSINKIGKFSNWEIWVVEVKLGKDLLLLFFVLFFNGSKGGFKDFILLNKFIIFFIKV